MSFSQKTSRRRTFAILSHPDAGKTTITELKLDREVAHQKDELMPRYASLIYNGYWWSPERRMLQAAIDRTQSVVNGLVRVRLYTGNLIGAGRRSVRDSVNTTVGVFGMIDVASSVGLPKHQEDFGQTLGVWGVPAGPYLQIPFLGPSTLRDAPALVVDWYSHPAPYVLQDYSEVLIGLVALGTVQLRASALGTEDLLDTISEDPYVALREFWLQRREFLVRDGVPADDDLWLDELEMLEQEEAFP